MKRTTSLILALIAGQLTISLGEAATITAASCASTHVQAAINAAVSGDQVAVPAGSCTWSGTGAVQISNKNITLKGAGIDVTTISIASAEGLRVPSANTGAFRITGFTFRSTGNFGTDTGFAMMSIRGGKGWRIDNNKLKIYSNVLSYAGGNGIYTWGDVGGLVDHNQFLNEETSTNCWHAALYVEGNGAAAWALPSQIGSAANTVFVEDNVVTETRQCSAHNPHAVYGQRGGIFVARHNTITNANIDSHGFCATYGTREFEISNNSWIISTSRNLDALMFIRGGTGVVYGNTLTLQTSASYNNMMKLTEYRCNNPSQCSGSVVQDGVTAGTCCTTYPCTDQIGRGQNQTLDPLYVWNNSGMSGMALVNISNECGGAQVSTFIQASRDYFIGSTPKPGYSPYTYPHPSISGGQPTSPPPAPQNLRVTSSSMGGGLQTIIADKTNASPLSLYIPGLELNFLASTSDQNLLMSREPG
ncbi:MAG: hypothetical protein IPP12_17050 [Nitrospira sp.]|nr:hypothetical protein [Nitrospira sp.]